MLSADEFLKNVARWSAVGLTIGADAPNQTEIDMDDNEYVAPDATAEHSPTLLQRAHKAAVNADVAEARSVDPADEIAFSVMYSLLALAHSAERIATALEGGRPHA